MNQTHALIDTLKSALRQQGFTYADCARWLDLSEASVKRLFARRQFSLQRMEVLCDRLGMDFIELVRQMEQRQARISQLSQAQEETLVSDPRLLLLTVCLLNHWPLSAITQSYCLTDTELQVLLGRLDSLGVIDLLPGNRVRLRVKRDFGWRKGGPIERLFKQHMEAEFLRGDFGKEEEARLVVSGMLSQSARKELLTRMRRLVETFNEAHLRDLARPLSEREGTTLLLAMRSWEPAFFARFRRQTDYY